MSEASDKEEVPSACSDRKRVCGIIMPISATVNHAEAHWATVRVLLARAIHAAGFEAIPVWENSATDRVSERIISNIFQFPVVIADISDANPNVMLELGLRLASKKPTIVVINYGETIPFDIRDFHIIHYPSSLSIIEMEDFINTLSGAIVAKDAATREQGYIPFLDRVVVDVVTPEAREVPFEKFMIERLEEISSLLAKSSKSSRPVFSANFGSKQVSTISNNGMLMVLFYSPIKPPSLFLEKVKAAGGTIEYLGELSVSFSDFYACRFYNINSEVKQHNLIVDISDHVRSWGGTAGIPENVALTLS